MQGGAYPHCLGRMPPPVVAQCSELPGLRAKGVTLSHSVAYTKKGGWPCGCRPLRRGMSWGCSSHAGDEQVEHGGHAGGGGTEDEAFEAEFVEFGLRFHGVERLRFSLRGDGESLSKL